jgi:ATP-dependent DNA helicase Rep
LLALAGAGTGKTRVITRKIVHLIECRNQRPDRIALTPKETAAAPGEEADAPLLDLYARYRQTPLACHVEDFDDLMALLLSLLQRDAGIAARWQGKLRNVLVDEYQDTKPAQYRLLWALTGLRHAFTAVGDDDQAI